MEEQFYFILPLMIRYVDPKKLPYLFTAAIAAAPILRIAIMIWFDNISAAYCLMPCRMDGLFLGALLAWSVRHPHAQSWLRMHRDWLNRGLGVLGMGYLVLLMYWPEKEAAPMWSVGYTWCACLYALILTHFLLRPRWRATTFFARTICWIGVRAYAIYLFHVAIARVIEAQGFHKHGLVVAVLASIGTLALAALSWHTVEQPLLSLARKYFRYNNAAEHRARTA